MEDWPKNHATLSVSTGDIQLVLQVASRDPITKLKLMKAYCNSFYGSVLWDLTNASIRDVCIAWRKGLRRIWDLPHNTHCNLLPLLCGRLWTSSAVVVQHLLRTFLVAITMQSAMLHDTVSISVGCRRQLVVMLSSVASDMVFSYKTLHLLTNLLFVDMFGILSLLKLIILDAVY